MLGNEVVEIFSNPSFRKVSNSEVLRDVRKNKLVVQKKFAFWVKTQRVNFLLRNYVNKELSLCLYTME